MTKPLAERMRPRSLGEYFGQNSIIGEDSFLSAILSSGKKATTMPSVLLWGPPGCGKTTLARLLAEHLDISFQVLSATNAGVKDVRELVSQADYERRSSGRQTLLFIDEIHRFNKTQQDALLPLVEEGMLILLGATTENPSFALNAALMSRLKVLSLKAHTEESLSRIMDKALADVSRGLGEKEWEIHPNARRLLLESSGGDARSLLNALEWLALNDISEVSVEDVIRALEMSSAAYSRTGEDRYELISAYQKSIRHSDVQASLYYLGAMLEGGEDPVYVARRLIRTASEDIGLAEPQALLQATAALNAVQQLGMPEANLALAQATAFLATAPKSNAVYEAYGRVQSELKLNGRQPVPLRLRNASTKFLKSQGYSEGYDYDHDTPQGVAAWQALPEKLQGRQFYRPKDRAFERELKKRMEYFSALHEGKTKG